MALWRSEANQWLDWLMAIWQCVWRGSLSIASTATGAVLRKQRIKHQRKTSATAAAPASATPAAQQQQLARGGQRAAASA